MPGKFKTKPQLPNEGKGPGNDINRVQTIEDINQQLQFEKLISQLSADFINLSFDQIDEKIDDGLKLIVESLGIDRSLLHEFSEDGQMLRLSHFFVKPGIKEPTSIITSTDQPYLTRNISENKIIGFERIEDLPQTSKREREYLIQQGVKSAIAIPLPFSVSRCRHSVRASLKRLKPSSSRRAPWNGAASMKTPWTPRLR